MIGRTHGIHAEPITLRPQVPRAGRPELARDRDAARRAAREHRRRQALGRGRHLRAPRPGDRGVRLRAARPGARAGRDAGRASATATPTLLAALALRGATSRSIATEIRHLQRTEVLRGSRSRSARARRAARRCRTSATRSPASSICGLARAAARQRAWPRFENVALWHERDISHSSVERVILPDAFLLADYLPDRLACGDRGAASSTRSACARNLDAQRRPRLLAARPARAHRRRAEPRGGLRRRAGAARWRAWRGEGSFRDAARRPRVPCASDCGEALDDCFDRGLLPAPRRRALRARPRPPWRDDDRRRRPAGALAADDSATRRRAARWPRASPRPASGSTADEPRLLAERLGRAPTRAELVLFNTMWSEHCSYKSTRHLLKAPADRGAAGRDSARARTRGSSPRDARGRAYWRSSSPTRATTIRPGRAGRGRGHRHRRHRARRLLHGRRGDRRARRAALRRPGRPAAGAVREIARGVVDGIGEYAQRARRAEPGRRRLLRFRASTTTASSTWWRSAWSRADGVVRSRVRRGAEGTYELILVGKPTDASGFGGASFASAVLDEATEQSGAVQLPDPFLKRVLAVANPAGARRGAAAGAAIGFKDLGAGGIACVSSELAAAGGFGIDVYLDGAHGTADRCPPRSSPAPRRRSASAGSCRGRRARRLSRSLPRSLPPGRHLPRGRRARDGTHAGGRRLPRDLERRGGRRVPRRGAHRRRAPRAGGRRRVRGRPRAPLPSEWTLPPAMCPRPRGRRHPGAGLAGRGLAGAAVPPLRPGGARGHLRARRRGRRGRSGAGARRAVRHGGERRRQPRLGALEPRLGAAIAVAEAARNVAAIGAYPWCLTDCLNFGDPRIRRSWASSRRGSTAWRPLPAGWGRCPARPGRGRRGLGRRVRGILPPLPFVSGNVSLYNYYSKGAAIPPSPIVACFGRLPDLSVHSTPGLKRPPACSCWSARSGGARRLRARRASGDRGAGSAGGRFGARAGGDRAGRGDARARPGARGARRLRGRAREARPRCRSPRGANSASPPTSPRGVTGRVARACRRGMVLRGARLRPRGRCGRCRNDRRVGRRAGRPDRPARRRRGGAAVTLRTPRVPEVVLERAPLFAAWSGALGEAFTVSEELIA